MTSTPNNSVDEDRILSTIDQLWEELDIDDIESMIEGTPQTVGGVLRSIAVERLRA